MLTWELTYTDLDDVERKEKFLFNLSKTDLIKMEASTEGGLEARIARITREENVAKLIVEFASVVEQAYGIRTPDGKGFDKSPAVVQAFIQTPAFDALIWELVTDDNKAAAWFKGVLPKEMEAEVQKLIEQQKLSLPAPPPPPPPAA